VTCSALVSGVITSPVGAHSSVNVSDYVNDFRFQRHVSSSSQLDSSTVEQLSADWLSQRSVLSSPSTPLLFLLRRFALNSTLFILRDLLSAVIISRHNESIRCCSPIHYRSKVWGHPDNFVLSMKTHNFIYQMNCKMNRKYTQDIDKVKNN